MTKSDASPWSTWRDSVRPIEGRLGVVALVLLGAEALFGIWMRFSQPSLLWLDEALTVNIAKLPLGSLHQALKEDGAPPLYYLLLHFWISLFGSSNAAVRSFSGVCSVATIVVLYFLVKRVWGREVGLLSVALLLGSSFAIYFATETRMYALVMLLCALGGLFLVRLFEAPCWQRMVPFGLTLAALAYTPLSLHYPWIADGGGCLEGRRSAKQTCWTMGFGRIRRCRSCLFALVSHVSISVEAHGNAVGRCTQLHDGDCCGIPFQLQPGSTNSEVWSGSARRRAGHDSRHGARTLLCGERSLQSFLGVAVSAASSSRRVVVARHHHVGNWRVALHKGGLRPPVCVSRLHSADHFSRSRDPSAKSASAASDSCRKSLHLYGGRGDSNSVHTKISGGTSCSRTFDGGPGGISRPLLPRSTWSNGDESAP